MKSVLLSAIAFATLAATPASATVFTGTTVGAPTFNRPLIGTPPTALSGVGTAVHYTVTPFTVTTTGTYAFLLSAVTPAGWDTFLGLYRNSFSAATPLVNALVYNDDFPSIGLSGFSVSLTAGTSYFALVTGFGNNDVGTYTLNITGPGTVVGGGAGVVPEPSTWALMLLGFAMTGAALRIRRRTVSFA